MVISIHTLRVEGDTGVNHSQRTTIISIHTLRVEGDDFFPEGADSEEPISIHTLRVEGDSWTFPALWPLSDFYPHPPCGG